MKPIVSICRSGGKAVLFYEGRVKLRVYRQTNLLCVLIRQTSIPLSSILTKMMKNQFNNIPNPSTNVNPKVHLIQMPHKSKS